MTTNQIFTIEKNIPIYESAAGKYFSGKVSPYRKLADQMQNGDSVLLSQKSARSLTGYMTKNKTSKSVTRKAPDGQVRVWKIAR